MYRKSWITILLILAISCLISCAAKPRIEISMETVEGREGAHVDARMRALTIEQRSVLSTVEPLDEVLLFELTKGQQINPYILYLGESLGKRRTVMQRLRNQRP